MDELGKIEEICSDHMLDSFDCGVEAINDWLRRRALKNHAAGATKTFVLPTMVASRKGVVGFYSLAAAQIAMENVTARARKNMPQPIPAILLARLGVSKEYKGRGLGAALLKDALKRCLLVAQNIGVRLVLVHAKDQDAKAFYLACAEFEESPTDPLHLFILTQDLAASFD